MKDYKGRNLADIVGSAGSMLLFVLFSACMLIIIGTSASTYSRIKEGFDQTFGISASLRYISNKIRNADSARIIGDGLALEYDGLVCVIYCGNDGLYERNLPEGNEPIAEGGDKISDIGQMKIEDVDGLFKITVSGSGETSSVLVRKS